MKIKKNDTVLIIKGKDRSKTGVVEKVLPKENKIIVTGINISKHHLKPSRKNPHGGIMDKLAPINAANVILMCPHCSKPSKIGYQINKSDKEIKKIRVCKSCQGSLN